MKKCIIPLITVILLAASCSGGDTLRRAAATITADELRDYTSTLGADSFMGRKPFTPGETITVKYLSGELEKIGFLTGIRRELVPGGPDGGDHYQGRGKGADNSRQGKGWSCQHPMISPLNHHQ